MLSLNTYYIKQVSKKNTINVSEEPKVSQIAHIFTYSS